MYIKLKYQSCRASLKFLSPSQVPDSVGKPLVTQALHVMEVKARHSGIRHTRIPFKAVCLKGSKAKCCRENRHENRNCPETEHKHTVTKSLMQMGPFAWAAIFACTAIVWWFMRASKEKSIKGQCVLITGAGHGIGKTLAFLFAKQALHLRSLTTLHVNFHIPHDTHT